MSENCKVMTRTDNINMIDFISNNSLPSIDFKKLNKAICKLNKDSIIYPEGECHSINVQLLENNEIISLNKEFRQKDYLPDVLSFDYRQEKMFEHELSGEVFISLEKAKSQAEEKNHSLEEELLFLTIHGILHVLGYDHKNDEQEAEMKNFEELINKEYKI